MKKTGEQRLTGHWQSLVASLTKQWPALERHYATGFPLLCGRHGCTLPHVSMLPHAALLRCGMLPPNNCLQSIAQCLTAFTLTATGGDCNLQMVPRGWWKGGLLADLAYYKPFSREA